MLLYVLISHFLVNKVEGFPSTLPTNYYIKIGVDETKTLNKTTNFSAPSDMPTWKEVAELSRQMEEKLDLRREVLEKLSLLDEDIHDTRKSLLKTLKALGKTENDKLSAATVRASVSAMAIDVLAKKLT